MAMFKMGRMVMRSLFKKPATLMYPVVPREYFAGTRGHISIDENSCILCGICQKKCPANAITVDRAKRTWTIARMQCIQCSGCVVACPKQCLTNENTYTTPNTEKVVDAVAIPKVEPVKAAGGGKSAPAATDGGEIKCDLDTCIFCGICQKKCPSEAIQVVRKDKTWTIDKGACVLCNVCVEACPKKCLVNE
ncbi:MAG: 4Fe-4S binding protein [Anaerovorax sp.]